MHRCAAVSGGTAVTKIRIRATSNASHTRTKIFVDHTTRSCTLLLTYPCTSVSYADCCPTKRARLPGSKRPFSNGFSSQNSQHVNINGKLIMKKAVKLEGVVNSMQEREQLHLKFSEGWFDNLKQR